MCVCVCDSAFIHAQEDTIRTFTYAYVFGFIWLYKFKYFVCMKIIHVHRPHKTPQITFS